MTILSDPVDVRARAAVDFSGSLTAGSSVVVVSSLDARGIVEGMFVRDAAGGASLKADTKVLGVAVAQGGSVLQAQHCLFTPLREEWEQLVEADKQNHTDALYHVLMATQQHHSQHMPYLLQTMTNLGRFDHVMLLITVKRHNVVKSILHHAATLMVRM